ncbi:glycosyltransferase [Butyrivibrio sp. WCD2001]|uniref:glycosyltransferase n=1 Tax=Butyrivibrio sp. WCD2001 TaxID=1280681 RepID=UPI0003FC8CA9|nr:glycosyltransferase [Butyrivibrio sp. WCD2001]
MISESDYRIESFKEKRKDLVGQDIVLYGTGVNARKMIESCPEYSILGILDEKHTGETIFGKKVLDWFEVSVLGAKAIVIAAQADSAWIIYKRIYEKCRTYNIDIYDMYGNRFNELAENLVRISLNLFGHSREEFENALSSASSISVNFQDALTCSDIRYGNELSELSEEDIIKHISLREEVLSALKQCASDKDVYVVSDVLTEEVIRKFLKKNDFDNAKVIVGKSLCNGVLRCTDNVGGHLHIGCDIDTDGVGAISMGMKYYNLPSCLEMILEVFPIKSSQKQSEYDLKRLHKLAFDAFKNPFAISEKRYDEDLLLIAGCRMNPNSILNKCKSQYKPDVIGYGECENVFFERVDNPKVSIIIPVYNQYKYTKKSLASIKRNSEDVKYEVIIADDCSNDETAEIANIVRGLKVIRNEKNLMFLRNCNNAAKHAKGEYIVFLNNDTQVQKGWLSALVDILDKDSDVGMVGSKLVYPDGTLQEAGGIVWKDGSAWNYGRNQDPEDAEYNYVREVDYISGASIMIRKSLWEEIGGFDDTFAPAYYEDTDLAFEVRKRGYQVVYQPESVVVHFEGKSNGTDTSEGIKAYQKTNAKKFYEKWKDELASHPENGKDVFLARDRSYDKKHILVIDHYIPHFDNDAGGRCTYMYLQQFVKRGYRVTFIGDNFAKDEPYRTIITQQGIEILYGNFYCNNWKKWLAVNGEYFDYFYTQRPHISINYVDYLRKCGSAKLFYFAHDLNHIREKREYEVTGDISHLEAVEEWKKIELELVEKSDVVHVVGTFEQKYLQDIYKDKIIRNIPLYIYEQYEKSTNDFETRDGILTVGGFNHHPNLDAVLWFAENVYPKILEKNPHMKWHIVGSKTPDIVTQMANDNIIVHGFVSDEELEEIYNNCRLAVVPLRYGAGVKGKILEAIYHRLPVITTPIGAEGIPNDDGIMRVCSDADEMIKTVVDCYEDKKWWSDITARSDGFIKKNYSIEAVNAVLDLDM